MNLQPLCTHNEAGARSSGVSGVDTLHTKNGRNGRFENTESTCIPAYHSSFSYHRKNRLPLVPLNSKTPLVLPDKTPLFPLYSRQLLVPLDNKQPLVLHPEDPQVMSNNQRKSSRKQENCTRQKRQGMQRS